MSAVSDALANAQVQTTELNAAVAQAGTFITDMRAQVAALQATIAEVGDPTLLKQQIDALAASIDAGEQALLSAINPPPAT